MSELVAQGKAVEQVMDIIDDWRWQSENLVLDYLHNNEDVTAARSDYRAIRNLYNKLQSIVQSGKIAERKLNELTKG